MRRIGIPCQYHWASRLWRMVLFPQWNISLWWLVVWRPIYQSKETGVQQMCWSWRPCDGCWRQGRGGVYGQQGLCCFVFHVCPQISCWRGSIFTLVALGLKTRKSVRGVWAQRGSGKVTWRAVLELPVAGGTPSWTQVVLQGPGGSHSSRWEA